jgi:molybdenum cofactor biosynthesis enzyme MoaA
MINPRLFDHYRIDTKKDLGISKVCPRPFDTVLIDKKGSCYACECTAWLPQSIGNLQVRTLDEIISGDPHKHIQKSILDGTYRYCNEHRCPYIIGGDMLDEQSTHIKHLRLAIDDSCNLKCPSCRKSMIFHKDGAAFDLGIRLADRINDWLRESRHPIKVHIGSDGDPFASLVYRHFMEHTPKRDDISYSILTNGLMFKEFHGRIPHVMANLQELGISVDGASKETYERLRLGGKWEKLLEGMECMAEMKLKHKFNFVLHFVVQKDNWHEMFDIAEMAGKYHVDKVFLNKIEDWNSGLDHSLQNFTSSEDFQNQLIKVKQNPIVRTWNLS